MTVALCIAVTILGALLGVVAAIVVVANGFDRRLEGF